MLAVLMALQMPLSRSPPVFLSLQPGDVSVFRTLLLSQFVLFWIIAPLFGLGLFFWTYLEHFCTHNAQAFLNLIQSYPQFVVNGPLIAATGSAHNSFAGRQSYRN